MLIVNELVRENKVDRGEFLWVSPAGERTEIGVLKADKLVCVYRCNACFTDALSLSSAEKIPEKTIFLLTEKEGVYSLYYALTDGGHSCSLSGVDGKLFLHIRGDRGEGGENKKEVCAVYTVSGTDVYALFPVAAAALAAHFPNLTLYSQKNKAKFYGKIGFCTYNAFYSEISEKGIFEVLEEWNRNGLQMGFLIVDEGWMSKEDGKMLSFEPDPKKFPRGMKGFTEMLKGTYGVEYVFFWHTFYGYWTGIDERLGIPAEREIFNASGVSDVGRRDENYFGGVNTVGEDFYPLNITGQWCRYPLDSLSDFYEAFYSYLQANGVDGTKIDAIGWLELLGADSGRKAGIAERYTGVMDEAVRSHMRGQAICCSCESPDFLYRSGGMSLIRTCKDYMPGNYRTYGPHIYFNAHNSLWLGEFFACDYDMFQSGGKGSGMHAIHRAVSGGPIYCSDNGSATDFSVLHALAASDGFVPVCDSYAKPTLRSLFVNIYTERKLFMQFNKIKESYLMAVYNCSLEDEGKKIEDFFTLSEIPYAASAAEKEFAVYSDRRGFLGIFDRVRPVRAALGFLQAELFTIVPVLGSAAWIGLEGKYVPCGFFSLEHIPRGERIRLKESGVYLLYSEKPVGYASVGYEKHNGNLYRFDASKEKEIVVKWEESENVSFVQAGKDVV